MNKLRSNHSTRRLFFQGLVLFSFLISVPTVQAEESAGKTAVLLDANDSFLASAPIFYSYEQGAWITSQPGKLFSTGEDHPGYALPYLKEKPAPIRYPHWAASRGWQGDLIVAVEILKTGKVGRWKITRSSGHSQLDKASVKAIGRWQFEPARQDGKPVVSCIQVPIRFVLGDPKN